MVGRGDRSLSRVRPQQELRGLALRDVDALVPDHASGGRRSRFVSARRCFASRRRSRAACVGFVGTRRRSTFRAARSCSTRRSRASSRLRHWLRSSCATARRTGPAFAMTRRFCTGVSAAEASTSNTASTRVSAVLACCPPGPLEREKRSSTSASGSATERVTRIDSPCMAAILLDVDGVLHVSGQAIPGAVDSVARLRQAGHRLRFVTNNSTRARTALAEELRGMGFELEDDELQTTSMAAARELEGRRVFALVMSAIVPDLRGVELVGDTADAVLVGGCDETLEPNQVFSYMNLGRAFTELQAGADLYCLHKNKWWQ